ATAVPTRARQDLPAATVAAESWARAATPVRRPNRARGQSIGRIASDVRSPATSDARYDTIDAPRMHATMTTGSRPPITRRTNLHQRRRRGSRKTWASETRRTGAGSRDQSVFTLSNVAVTEPLEPAVKRLVAEASRASRPRPQNGKCGSEA